jgi:excisionase family DNA binding protein
MPYHPEPMQPPDPRYEPISVAEAAARLAVSESTVRRMIRDGKLTAEREQRPQGEIVRVLWPAANNVSPPATPSSAAPAIDLSEALSAALGPLSEALALERTERQAMAQEAAVQRERAARAEAERDILRAELERVRARRWWHWW